MIKKIKAAVLGSTGYAGQELTRLLFQHPEVELTFATSRSYEGQKYSDVYSNFAEMTDLVCAEDNIEKLANNADVIFIALPHGLASSKVNEFLLQKVKIIDLGADFRLNNLDVYKEWYQTEHNNENCLKQAVYGLCEWEREQIKKTNLIANPGCYTTCSILTLAPLVKEKLINTDSIVIDAKSGVTGAGRSLNLGIHYCEVNETIKAYKVASHRHTPEIEQELSKLGGSEIKLSFTPHLTPMNRGILATCYAKLNDKYNYRDIKAVYEKYYKDEFFIRLTQEGVFPETKWVKGSNFTDIGFAIDERTNNIVAIGALDNLIKGAAGQAVQNMNIMFEINERVGIDQISAFPI